MVMMMTIMIVITIIIIVKKQQQQHLQYFYYYLSHIVIYPPFYRSFLNHKECKMSYFYAEKLTQIRCHKQGRCHPDSWSSLWDMEVCQSLYSSSALKQETQGNVKILFFSFFLYYYYFFGNLPLLLKMISSPFCALSRVCLRLLLNFM